MSEPTYLFEEKYPRLKANRFHLSFGKNQSIFARLYQLIRWIFTGRADFEV